jgi:hypothetical protein
MLHNIKYFTIYFFQEIYEKFLPPVKITSQF